MDGVVVPASAVAGGERDLPMYVAMHVTSALDSGAMYERSELPREALLAAQVEYYRSEVDNGGHPQFIVNSGWCAEDRANLREGLALLGVEEATRIFADLEAFAAAEPERFDRCCPGTDEGIDPFFSALDARFNGGVSDAISAANAAWIKARPWLRTLPDADYFRTRAWEPPPHPRREARIAARRRSRPGRH